MEFQNFLKSTDVNLNKVTNIIKQYLGFKLEMPDSIVFFRIGDFFETYFEDAYAMSKVTNVTLTKRKFKDIGEILMAGVPHKKANLYIAKLLKANYKIAIVDQIEDASKDGIMERKLVRVITPGVLMEEEFLDSRKNNFIAAILRQGGDYGFSYCDISTGEFFVTEGNLPEIILELSKINPKELLVPMLPRLIEDLKAIPEKEPDIDEVISKNYPITIVSKKDYETNLLEFDKFPLAKKCANAIVSYVKETQKDFSPRLDMVLPYEISTFLQMNKMTRKNLELTRNSYNGKKYGSLFWAVDRCKTSMGKRLLRRFINEPLYNIEKIKERQNAVIELIGNQTALLELGNLLFGCIDVLRLSARLSNATISPKELLSLKDVLFIILPLKNLAQSFKSPILNYINEETLALLDYAQIIEKSITEDPNANIKSGGIVRDGASPELDVIRGQVKQCEKEIQAYSDSLGFKIIYTRSSSYCIEVSPTQVKNIGANFRLKKKMSNMHRYTTDKLLEIEEKILSLKMKANELEYSIFSNIKEYSRELTNPIRAFAQGIAMLDVMYSYASLAIEFNLVCPSLSNDAKFIAKSAKHPSLMQLLKSYNPTDIDFDADLPNFIMLTGANMSGKSTYLRLCSLVIILTQMGAFVPAECVELGLIDRIFVKMGSYDELVNNNSAFMCEMLEVKSIIETATDKSFIALDETAKSTSYKEGLAISYAIIKYIAESIKAKSIFATHFYKLYKIEDEIKNVVNYKFELVEENGVNKRSLKKGYCEQSNAIEIAQKAELPLNMLEFAKNYLANI